MLNIKRLISIVALTLGLVASAELTATAGLSFNILPLEATSNSVWNMTATWSNSKGIWPVVEGGARDATIVTDGFLEYGGVDSIGNQHSIPIGLVRPSDPDTGLPFDGADFFPQFGLPDGFAGFVAPNNVTQYELFQSLAWVWLQPDPALTITETSGESLEYDEKYDHGLDYFEETVDIFPYDEKDGRQDVHVNTTTHGLETIQLENILSPPKYIDKQPAIADDEATLDKDETRPATNKQIIVPSFSPVWLVDVRIVDANGNPGRPIKCKLEWASIINPATGLGSWPRVRVIELLEAAPNQTTLRLQYYYPGTRYVATKQFPLPLPYTVYRFPFPQPQPDGTYKTYKIKFNPGILNLDSTKTNPLAFSFDDATFGQPLDSNPLTGIYTNESLTSLPAPDNYPEYWQHYFQIVDGLEVDGQVVNDLKCIFLTKPLPAGAGDLDDKLWIRYTEAVLAVASDAGNDVFVSAKDLGLVVGDTVRFTGTGGGVTAGRVYYVVSVIDSFTFKISITPGGAAFNVLASTDNEVQKLPVVKVVKGSVVSTSGIVTTVDTFSTTVDMITGVFLDQNCTGTNFFVPYEGQSAEHPDYAFINLPIALVVSSRPFLYFNIPTNAVDAVYTTGDGGGTNYYSGNDASYSSKMGLIRLDPQLPVPTPDTATQAWTKGEKTWVTYRPLSRNTFTPGHPTPAAITPQDEITIGIAPYPIPTTAYTTDPISTVIADNKFILGAKNLLPIGTYGAAVQYYVRPPDAAQLGAIWIDGMPLYYVNGSPATGAVYRGAFSAGLNLSNPKQQPSWDWLENSPDLNNKLIFDPRQKPMNYLSSLTTESHAPKVRKVTATVYWVDRGALNSESQNIDVTVHDSSPSSPIDYGGQVGSLDWLTCYPDTLGGSWPQGADIDPLSVEPVEEAVSNAPDDGSSSTTFVFRVRYHNDDGLPPLSWMSPFADPQRNGSHTGVVLYLDANGTGDYRPHFMDLERPDLESGDADYAKYQNVYIFRLIPHSTVGVFSTPLSYPWADGRNNYLGTYFDNNLYQSLACGTYHFFFACSDDSLKFDTLNDYASFPFEHQSAAGQIEWGQGNSWTNNNSTGLDPSLPRRVTGLSELDRRANRRYSFNDTFPVDSELYVDRPIRAPGFFEGGHVPVDLMKSEYHPRVTSFLSMPSVDAKSVRYDDQKYGYGRFFGTLNPFYRAVNPTHAGCFTLSSLAALAETCGATTKTDNVFRILWKQIDNKPPMEIKVFINDASEKTGTTSKHAFIGYTLVPSADQIPPLDYRKGVWYEYKTKLPVGAHCYYFRANDGEHVVRFPVRPDKFNYDIKGQAGYYMDWWTPTESLITERGAATYYDNDYISGPYVNNPCVLSDSSVTPGTGKEGQTYKYRVKYSDADGQRVHNAYINIEINDRGDVRKLAMLPEKMILDPENNHSLEYKTGVYYYLDTATIRDMALEKGVRRFYFEFTDDWGRQSDVNDIISGELTRLPVGDGNWIDGPVISENKAPTLTRGSVNSQDGTANAATLWTYRVTYRDMNNDSPVLIKVLLGLLQPDGKTIVWDDGHTMAADDASDSVYSDGKAYNYQTRLGGVDTVNPGQPVPDPKQYLYAFEAYDGTDWAAYKSSANEEVRSDAAGCMVLQDMVSVGDDLLNYKIKPLLVQKGTSMTPGAGGVFTQVSVESPGDIIRVEGIYLTENLNDDVTNPQSYYDESLDTRVYKNGDASIPLTASLPAGTSTVYIKHLSVRKVVTTQTGTVADLVTAVPSDVGDIERVMGVYVTEQLALDIENGTNYYRPYDAITVTAGSGVPSTATTVWVHYEAQSPIVGPLPIDLPAPAGVIPDAQLYEDYSNNGDPILIDDQKNGWVSADYPEDRGTVVMNGQCVFEGSPSSAYVKPENANSIASVEGVYLNSAFSGLNYAQTQIWKVDPADATRKTIMPKDSTQLGRVLKVYGVYTDAEIEGTNYYSANISDGFTVSELSPIGENWPWRCTGQPATGVAFADVESIVGVYVNAPTSYDDAVAMNNTGDNLYASDHISMQTCTPRILVKPDDPWAIQSVLGVYLSDDLGGVNYYDPNVGLLYYTGDTYIYPTSWIDNSLTQKVFVSFVNTSQVVDMQEATLEAAAVNVSDSLPMKQVRGVYLSEDKSGTNYYVPALANPSYVQGSSGITLTSPIEAGNVIAYVEYEDMGFGFGPAGDYIALNTGLVLGNMPSDPDPLYLAYYSGGRPDPTTGKLTLKTAIPAGISDVYIQVSSDVFNCGDSYVKLTEELYAEDTLGIVVASLTVQPTDSTVIGGVLGVWRSKAESIAHPDWNIYAGTENPFKPGDRYIKLKTTGHDLPATGTTGLYIKYSPKKVYVKYSDIRYTHQLRGQAAKSNTSWRFYPDGWNTTYLDKYDIPHLNVHMRHNLGDPTAGMDRFSDAVSSGIVGIWLESTRTGVNFFNPKLPIRFTDDPIYKLLTTPVPGGTDETWARAYQSGEYHIDRWNRDVKFLTLRKVDIRLQASYFFGTKMPLAIGANTPPELISGTGKVTPIYGSRTMQYIYSVTYRDMDGPNGQAPAYVRVYIDGAAYDMTPPSGGSAPYREGAVYQYTVTGGLSGAAHKYHFECSDGAAVAWYDANGSHQSLLGAIVESVVDIDGPWVNDAPQLSAGSANPNPATGTIKPSDSVDYFVTFTDPDNDEPYFYDSVRDVNDVDANNNGTPDGQEYSGSPRLWIDSGFTDVSSSGSVFALEDDPMQVGKKRTIVAAGTPGWTLGQFAGKLIQITNGTISGRVYLIQSNTENKLVIATDDLTVDGVVAGGADASSFMINGLLMSKADPSKQDFTQGVVYKITVPKLAVGNHKFHFTARSRAVKPQWLLDRNDLTAADRVSYSVQVNDPQSGDTLGPNVASTPPSGNTEPTLTNILATSLYVGPKAQLVAYRNATEVGQLDATLWAQIRDVRGIFKNANDIDLAVVGSATEDAKSYYHPKTTVSPFKLGDTVITLGGSLPTPLLTSQVQFGSVLGQSLLEVTPDKASAIGSVVGVYLTSDPTKAGVNYFVSANLADQGTFTNGKIQLQRDLPSGTKQVYVDYNLGGSVSWAGTPIYVKYFSTTSQSSFKASDLVTFRVNYSDPNDDSPAYHDNVQGYIKLVFNDISQTRQMRLLNFMEAADVIDYKIPVAFSTEPMTLPEGKHKYHFEASDGYYTVRYPEGVLGDPTANDYSIAVNYKPILISGRVEPAAGSIATEFTFATRYKDVDGVVGKLPRVTVRITGQGAVKREEVLDMTPAAGTPNYSSGVDYTLRLRPNALATVLSSGVYSVVFEATDSDGEDAVSYPNPGQSQITFTVRDTSLNNRPVLASPTALNIATSKITGKLNDYFVYRVKYSDADGDAPIRRSDGRRDMLALTIDKGTAGVMQFTMTKASNAPVNPIAADYIAGVDYVSTDLISGKTLRAGKHTFEINASDGTVDAVAVSGNGPILLIPFFDNFRVVAGNSTIPNDALALLSAGVSDEVLIVGKMMFLSNPDSGSPGNVSNVSVHVRKPDGSIVTLEGSVNTQEETEPVQGGGTRVVGWSGPVVVNYEKAKGVDPALFWTGKNMTLTASGQWVVTASWPGDMWWDKTSTEGHEVNITVGGRMRTVVVADALNPDVSAPRIDMITPPMIITSTDVGQVFGVDRARDMRIIRWDAASHTYFRYGIDTGFPAMRPGEAVWIKPKSSYPKETISQAQVDSGDLALGNPKTSDTPVYSKQHRVIKAAVNDYNYVRNEVTGEIVSTVPCVIEIKDGWNQIGNIFFNYKNDTTLDVGLPISEVMVRYLGVTKSITDAALAGWVRDYMWRYDPIARSYKRVHATATDAERVLMSWNGYWVRAFVNCELVIDPNTTFNGLAVGVRQNSSSSNVSQEQLDMPPPAPE